MNENVNSNVQPAHSKQDRMTVPECQNEYRHKYSRLASSLVLVWVLIYTVAIIVAKLTQNS